MLGRRAEEARGVSTERDDDDSDEDRDEVEVEVRFEVEVEVEVVGVVLMLVGVTAATVLIGFCPGPRLLLLLLEGEVPCRLV